MFKNQHALVKIWHDPKSKTCLVTFCYQLADHLTIICIYIYIGMSRYVSNDCTHIKLT